MSRYHRVSAALSDRKRWYHGTSAPEFPRFRPGEAYLTDDPAEAMGFAEGGHLGGSTGGEPRVLEVSLAPGGPVMDADDEVSRIVMDEHPELDDIDDLMARHRAEGARYVDFTHPGFAGGDIRVRVSLHPEEDLEIVDRPGQRTARATPYRRVSAMPDVLYHGTFADAGLAPGDRLVPRRGRGWRRHLEEALEAHRPPGALARDACVYMVAEPSDCLIMSDYDTIWAVRPDPPVQASDLGWYGAFCKMFPWSSADAAGMSQGDRAELQRLADGYWSGEPYDKGRLVMEYRAPSATVLEEAGERETEDDRADPAGGRAARRAATGETDIEAIAAEVRRRLGVDHEMEDGEAPKALCLDFARGLADELVRRGYSAGVTQGTFEVDWPDEDAYDEWDSDDFEAGDEDTEMSAEEVMGQAMHFPLHYWVRVTAKDGEPIGPVYADITADQFDDECKGSAFDQVWVWTGETERHQPQRHDFGGAVYPRASRYHRASAVIADGDTEYVYHGTSLAQLEAIRDAGWTVQNLYLADVREKSDDYAERQAVAESEDAVPVVLQLDMAALRRSGQVEVDRGSGPEWEHDMGQFVYSGPLRDAITNMDEVVRELRDEWGEEFAP